jgi:hypothetical protein
MSGKASAAGGDCEHCGSQGDVYVTGRLYCASCALEYHFEDLQRQESSLHTEGDSGKHRRPVRPRYDSSVSGLPMRPNRAK